MEMKNKNWLLLISAVSIVVLLFLSFYDPLRPPANVEPSWGNYSCKDDVCNVSMPRAAVAGRPRQGPRPAFINPLQLVGLQIALSVLATAPLLYYFIAKKLEEKLETNMTIISKLISKGNSTRPKIRGTDNKDIILKFLNPNERKVLEALLEKNTSVLQSEISKIEGMTKLKTHRTVKELEKKGIITTERRGKTNLIVLSEDIKEFASNQPSNAI